MNEHITQHPLLNFSTIISWVLIIMFIGSPCHSGYPANACMWHALQLFNLINLRAI